MPVDADRQVARIGTIGPGCGDGDVIVRVVEGDVSWTYRSAWITNRYRGGVVGGKIADKGANG